MDRPYINNYKSPIGNMILTADDIGLTGLWFERQKQFVLYPNKGYKEKELPIFNDAKHWLDVYFSGKEPDLKIPLHPIGTDFQKEIWDIVDSIPYGKTMTYGEIAKRIAQKRDIKKMSAQAVGGAVGKNKISIIIPCHRVIGTNRRLTGYAGGLGKKIALLKLENIDIKEMNRCFPSGR